MEKTGVYLDGAQRLKNIIHEQFGNLFHAYFVGTPEVIPEAAMPCVVLQKVSGSVSAGATMTDDLQETVMVHLLVNGKDGFGSPDSDDTVMRQLFTLVEGRDPTSGQYLKTSVLYAIRHNLTLDETVINHNEDINYDVTPRSDQPTVNECVVTVSIHERVLVPNRT
jgi:hypothetical protein